MTSLHKPASIRIILTISILLVILLSLNHPADAQVMDNRWSEPLLLSNPDAAAGVPALVSDPYGTIHAFWPELDSVDRRPTIQYARFNGTQWTLAQDIYIGSEGAEIRALSASLAADDMLHLTWVGSQTGPVFYTSAIVTQANIARAWSEPVRVEVSAYQAYLNSDPADTLHLIYSTYFGRDRGVFYSRSDDQGSNWSTPQALDPTILPNYSPHSLEVAVGELGDIHVVWFDMDTDTFRSDTGLVQYIHSLDGGKTWSQPFLVAGGLSGDPSLLGFAYPLIALTGEKVVLIWAEGELPYRKSRFSPDYGTNWTPSENIQSFGDLHGQAFDSLTVDGEGRVHFFGDIRYPQGLYQAIWDRDRWFNPSMIYLIQPGVDGQSTSTSIHVHNVKSAVLLGNQLVVTLMDPPDAAQRRLFVINSVLKDVSAEIPLPSPTLQVTATPTPTTTPVTQPTNTAVWTNEMQAQSPPIPENLAPSGPIMVAVAISGILLIGIFIYRLRNLRR